MIFHVAEIFLSGVKHQVINPDESAEISRRRETSGVRDCATSTG